MNATASVRHWLQAQWHVCDPWTSGQEKQDYTWLWTLALRFSMPAASDDLMHSFYPLLANAMIQADLNSVEDEGSAAIGAPRL